MDEVWWEQVTNASLFLKSVVELILADKSTVLVLPPYVPWKGSLQEKIVEGISRQDSRKTFDFMESPEGNIGEHLLNKYCEEDIRILYRPNKTHTWFLAQREDIVLNDRYIWVKNIPDSQLSEWITFLSEYFLAIKKDVSPGVFILETSNGSVHIGKKGVSKIAYDKEITRFDTYTFCTLAVSGRKLPDFLKNYLAGLAAEVCGSDVELCAECIRRGNYFLKEPYDTIKSIAGSAIRSDGTAFSIRLEEPVINRLIWKAQLKIVFPVIEDYRGSFVEKYHREIARGLPVKSSNGEEYTEPEDVEIGTLIYMAAAGLFNIDGAEHDKLRKFKEARNILAHLKTLSIDEVEAVLQP